MNTAYKITETYLKEHDIYLRKFDGFIKLKELTEIWSKMFATSQENSMYKKRLLDLSECDLQIDREFFDEFIMNLLNFSNQMSHFRLAIVTLSPIATAFTQIAEKKFHEEISSMRINIFSSMDAAIDWLGYH
ncbi:MAG: hypothetical protein Q7J34_11705 [Bacteroidales bacterium]|jgi:hypothetical protein|nr:hypothetical protein [Bacteroidales bacterium]